MAQLQKVSWRTVGYTALGCAVAVGSVVAIVNSDGVRPTSLTSNAATRWLVDTVEHRAVLVDGLAGRVVAKIATGAEVSGEVAVQGAGGAFLVTPSLASARTISTSKLQLGTAQPVGLLSEVGATFGVGASGLTVVSPKTSEASIVAADYVTRPITIPKSDSSLVAADGSMWLFTQTEATHVNIDESTTSRVLRSQANQKTTVGAHAVVYNANTRLVSWLDGADGADVSIQSIPNATEAVLQVPGDDASCVWLGVGNTLACVGQTSIERTVFIPGLNMTSNDRLAIAGAAAVVVRSGNGVERIDLENESMATESQADVRDGAQALSITAAGDLVWLDDQSGQDAWVVHRFGINHIDKKATAQLFDAQGQVVLDAGPGGDASAPGSGDSPGDQANDNKPDGNGVDDPPEAIDDSVTARAGNTVTIPVTGNDFDPDGDAISVDKVGNVKKAGHGTTDVLNGSSVAYVPETGFGGSDSFSYTIIDEHGNTDTATVNVELFPVDSPNRPPIAREDHVKTRLGRAVTIDVLANDIDPERDMLSIPTFRQNGNATITDAKGPTGLAALKYDPPPGRPGIFTFTYQAADPQGGTSDKTRVTVEVVAQDADNAPPDARPDAIRLRVGSTDTLDVKANDTDPDGDDLLITHVTSVSGITAKLLGQQLSVTVEPGAAPLSTLHYTLSDGTPGHEQDGHVLVVRIGDTAVNRPPVANPDAERVVIGASVKIPVTANDIDPDTDAIRLLSVTQPAGGAGTTTVEGNSVRFIPNLSDITEPTPVNFSYRITDGKGHEVTGKVTVTVLVEALPHPPFARDDFADTVTDKPVTIDVLDNDLDPSGGKPALRGDPICTGDGRAVQTDDQRVTFTPPSGEVGTFRCKYKVINTQQLDAEASIIVTVTAAPPGNHDPVMDSSVIQRDVRVGASLVLNANDLAHDDDRGDNLVFVTVSKPEHGFTSFSQKASSFTYQAPPTGSADHTPVGDNLEVTISDQHDGNVRGTISIRILEDAPTVAPQVATHDIAMLATVGEPSRFDIVGDLRESNNGATLTLVSATPDSSTPAAQVETSGGSVVVTPSASGVLFLTYVVESADRVRGTAKIRVTIADPAPVNPAPVAVADQLTVASGGSGNIDLLANDLGIDAGDTPTVTLINRPPASFGTVDLNDGILTLTAAPGPSGGVAVIRYELADGSGQTSRTTVTLTILPCSDSAPEVLAARVFTPYETPIGIDLTQYVVSGSIVPGSVAGAGLTGPTGTYTPPAGMNGSELVTYTVANGCQQVTQGALTIDVNRAPVGGVIDRNLARGSTMTLTVNDLASDDEALKITAISGNPSWVTLVLASGAPGTFDPTTIAASPPNNVGSGTYTFNATVEDPGGLTATATINLSINNLAPTAVADAYTTVFSQYTFDPTLNDFDSEPGPLEVQILAAAGGPATVLGHTGNVYTVSLPHGVSEFNYTIVDSGGLTASSTVTITSNSPPVAPDITETTNQPTINITYSPTDPDGDPLNVACPSTDVLDVIVILNPNPSNPLEANRVTLHVTVIPEHFHGPAAFTCAVTDPFGATTTSTITLTIND